MEKQVSINDIEFYEYKLNIDKQDDYEEYNIVEPIDNKNGI